MRAGQHLIHLSGDVSLASFCPEGFVGIDVPIGTDDFVQNSVAKTCRTTIDDVEKSDAIQDVLYTIISSVFARLPDFSMLIATF